jgi:multidrug efflux system membrane fusion protein
MRCRLLAAVLGLGLILAVGLSGCGEGPSKVAPAEATVIPVAKPVARVVTDYVIFTGRTNAKDMVDVKARVTGYLKKMPFKEGSDVDKDDVLFEIDPRPYKAQLDAAEGQVTLAQAQLKLAQSTLARDQAIAKDVKGAISQQQIDQDMAAVEEAQARVKAQKASLEVNSLNLEFTKVKSPIAGKVSRYYMTEGNLVIQDQTLLTTVVSHDPIYAYFDMDESTLLRLRQAIAEGRMQRAGKGGGAGVPVQMALQGQDWQHAYTGTVNFVDNQVNPATGSITVRGQFANPLIKPANIRLLSPGMFVRIRFQVGTPHPALLVIDRAIGSDQGLKYVYVVGADHKVVSRPVTTGALQDDGLRVVEGVGKDEWVVVGALQQVRQNMIVQTEEMAMPTLGAPLAGLVPGGEPGQQAPTTPAGKGTR